MKISTSDKEEFSEVKNNFINYFEGFYLKPGNRGFYMGYLPPDFGNTNNNLEGHHWHIKHNIFEKKVRSISNFFFS